VLKGRTQVGVAAEYQQQKDSKTRYHSPYVAGVSLWTFVHLMSLTLGKALRMGRAVCMKPRGAWYDVVAVECLGP